MLSNKFQKFGLLAGGILVGCTAGAAAMFCVLLGFNPPTICPRAEVSPKLTAVEATDLPQNIAHAVLAAEDHRFYEHGGVDMRAVARSLAIAKERGAVVQGASTLTMQLAKNVVLADHSRTFGRKLREVFAALKIERAYTKDEILAAYLNQVQFVLHGKGIAEASRALFNRSANELTLEQSALIAGLAKAPGALSPWANPQQALQRRNAVLTNMRTLDYVSSDSELERLKQQPLGLFSSEPLLS